MKRLLAAFIALITLFSVLSMTACQNNEGAPDGMQLVKGGKEVGYNFWGPEEWVVSNYGNIACTYASKIDMSSMTFVESEMPAGTIAEYFESEKTKFPYEIKVSVNGKNSTFGNAKEAKTYVYSYTYKEFSYTCMQIFVINSDRFYIFTYTASNADRGDGKTYYEYYLDKVTEVINSFEFTGNPTDSNADKNYEYDNDGYKLISDKTIAGFKMYVPKSFNVDYSSALVSASHQDGSNVTMAQATYTGVQSKDYWEARKENINAFANNTVVEIEVGKQIDLPDTRWALAYEYTYVFEGVKYHVYQVQIVASATTGYVFTYTASEELYETHLAEMKKVLNKFEY